MSNIEKKVESRISRIVENLGYKLYDVRYDKEEGERFLRISIEKADGEIDYSDCKRVNDAITDILDEEDYIKERYFLEISSTGIEKIIRKERHLQENIGEMITVKLYKSVRGLKEYIGKLIEFNNQTLTIEIDENLYLEIERKNISLIKKYYDWDKAFN